jgi:L-aminopeptidase/D-esterase-like protein
MRPGLRNLVTDVPGLAVGNAEDEAARSGVTVVLPEAPATCAIDVRGGGPGTRETDLLDPSCLVERVHGIALAGGSAFGLEAASGVTSWLAERGRGLAIGDAIVPIVPAAILFDLINGGDKNWGGEPPYRNLGRLAAAGAEAEFELGNAGAGLGAVAGSLKGGLGSASLIYREDSREITLGALAAVNSLGSATLGDGPAFWAWPYALDGELGERAVPDPRVPMEIGDHAFNLPVSANTTLAVVATDLPLTKADATRVAIMAQDGLARALRPVHTPFDGDVVFVLSTGEEAERPSAAQIARLGMFAADCVARAIARGVYEARSLGGFPAYRELYG